MEPLLSSPTTDVEIYMGKLLAGTIVPLIAGYLSIFIYVLLLLRRGAPVPEAGLIFLICVLNAVQAVLMVSAAIVISTQSTSVRAANLLASFIIIPMGVLIQGESYLIFWGSDDILWWAVIAVAILTGLIIRLGLSHFQREKLLGREIDMLDLKWLSRTFWKSFSGTTTLPGIIRFMLRSRPAWFAPQVAPASLGMALFEDYQGFLNWYRIEIPGTIRKTRPAIIITVLVGLIAIFSTYFYVDYRLPQEKIGPQKLGELAVEFGMAAPGGAPVSQGLESLKDLISAPALFVHNSRTALLISLVGFISFGMVGYLFYIVNMAIIGGLLAVFNMLNISPLLIFAAGILPHGVFELTALTLSISTMMYATARLVTPEDNLTIGEVFISAMADWTKIFIAVCIPLFLVAALIEANITPLILIKALGNTKILPDG